MISLYKVIPGRGCCISSKNMHSSLLSWRDRFLEKLKDKRCSAQDRRSGEMANHLFETYKNTFMPHGNHMFQTAYDTIMENLFTYPSSTYSLALWKCVLCCCAKYTGIDIPGTESDRQKSNVISISHCTVHGGLTFNEKKQCQFCETSIY